MRYFLFIRKAPYGAFLMNKLVINVLSQLFQFQTGPHRTDLDKRA